MHTFTEEMEVQNLHRQLKSLKKFVAGFFWMCVGVGLPGNLFAEAKFGANYLRYIENGFTKDRSYKVWLSVSEPLEVNNSFGLGLYGSYENLPTGESIYGEFKPYYEISKNTFKVDLRTIHMGWKDKFRQGFEKQYKIGVGIEVKLWD